MKILGIDPGYAITGYGVIVKDEKTGNITPIDYGVITTPSYECLAVRLAMLDEELEKIITVHNPCVIAIEELFFGANTTTAIKVAHARCIILLKCIKKCGLLYEYTPLQVKMALTGNGRADKKQIQYMIAAILNLKSAPQPDDAADALAVAITHANTADFVQRILK